MFHKLHLNHILFDQKFPLKNELSLMRNQAFKKFENKQLPSFKDEEWKYTDLNFIFNYDFKSVFDCNFSINYNQLKKYFISGIDSYKLVFINNVFNSFLSEINQDEANIYNLSYAFKQKKYENIIKSFYNSSPSSSEAFFLLNTSFFYEGSFIHIKKNTILSKPIEIVNFIFGEIEPIMTHPRTFILIDNQSQVQIIERNQNIGNTPNFTNHVSEIFLGNNAKVDIYKIQNDTSNSHIIDYTSIIQSSNSLAEVHTFSIGGKFIRNNLQFYHKEENCNSILKGITLIGSSELVDHHTLVEHLHKNSQSHQLYKGIFYGNSKGIFNGKIIVGKEAQKTNAFQQNDNLIFSKNASVNTKPQLEIFADDVKCSHGCTIGQFDEESMFYLQSRGISKKEAIALLTFAFTSDILRSTKIDQIKNEINTLIANKLKNQINFDIDN